MDIWPCYWELVPLEGSLADSTSIFATMVYSLFPGFSY